MRYSIKHMMRSNWSEEMSRFSDFMPFFSCIMQRIPATFNIKSAANSASFRATYYYTLNIVRCIGTIRHSFRLDIHLSGANLSHTNIEFNISCCFVSHCIYNTERCMWYWHTIGLNYTKFAMLHLLLDFQFILMNMTPIDTHGVHQSQNEWKRKVWTFFFCDWRDKLYVWLEHFSIM